MLTNWYQRYESDRRAMTGIDFASVTSCWTDEMLAESLLADKEGRAPSMDNVHPTPLEIWGTPDELYEQTRKLQECVPDKH